MAVICFTFTDISRPDPSTQSPAGREFTQPQSRVLAECDEWPQETDFKYRTETDRIRRGRAVGGCLLGSSVHRVAPSLAAISRGAAVGGGGCL